MTSRLLINDVSDPDHSRKPEHPLSQLIHKPERDVRIDLLRGLALLVIATNHLPGNPVRQMTPVAWGLSDMAEVFLFLSGFVCGLSARKLQQQPKRLIKKFLLRSAQLYLAYIVTGFLLVEIVRTFHIAGQVDYIGESLLSGSMLEVLQSLMLINSRVSHLCILLVYVLLLVLFPLLLMLADFLPQRVFILSMVIYGLSQFGLLHLSDPWRRAFYFNPFAWQWIFMSGAGLALFSAEERQRFLGHRQLVLTAFIGLFGFLVISGSGIQLPYEFVSKANLGILRVIHFACCVIVVRALLPISFSKTIRNWCKPILLCSRQSLATYCGGALISIVLTKYTSSGIVQTHRAPLIMWAMLNVTTWGGCILIAWSAERFKMLLKSHHQENKL